MSTTEHETVTIDKVIRPGTVPDYNGRQMHVFCRIRFEGRKLSVSGVEGPRASGNCAGGAGQIDMHYAHRNPADDDARYDTPTRPEQFTFADGWDAELWLDFLDVWKRLHLNDMQAGCEHQRASWDTSTEVTLYHWRLDSETLQARRAAKKDAEARLLAGETVAYDPETLALMALPWDVTTATDERPEHYAPRDGMYWPHVEKKTAGWVRPDEHPAGLLTRPCEVCGYKYGTEWRKVDVPAEVLAFLHGLPEADRTPAWV